MFFCYLNLNNKISIIVICFIAIVLLIFLIIIKLKIKIEIRNIDILTTRKKKVKDGYQLKIKLYIFSFIKINIFDINKYDYEKLKKGKLFNAIKKKRKNNVNLFELFIKYFSKINFKVENTNLYLAIGTNDASITSYLVAIAAAIIGISLKNQFEIKPIYENRNIIKFNFDGDIIINIGEFIQKIIKDKFIKKIGKVKKKNQIKYTKNKIRKNGNTSKKYFKGVYKNE